MPQYYETQIPWSLAKIDVRFKLYRRLKLNNGLLMLYPVKRYSIPAGLRFLAHPSMLESTDNETEFRLKTGFAVIKVDVYPDTQVTYFGAIRDVVQIYVLPPKEIKYPKYYLVVERVEGKKTGMGGMEHWEVAETNAVYLAELVESSSTGRHWMKYYVAVLPFKDPKLILHRTAVSNRGNVTDELIDVINGRTQSRFVIETVKELNPYARVVKVRDRLFNEEYVGIRLEYHKALKTNAFTNHEVRPWDNIVPVFNTYHPSKTHWYLIAKLRGPIEIVTTRVSNKGNKKIYIHNVNPEGVFQ